MSESICLSIPRKEHEASLKTVNFVYETEFVKLKQPFQWSCYCAYLVTQGSGTIKMNNAEYKIGTDTLFFCFPSVPFEVLADSKFEYIWISFLRYGTDGILKELGINTSNFVFYELERVSAFWKESVRRTNKYNMCILTECALLYALSFINKEFENKYIDREENVFSQIINYINNNFYDSSLSVKKIAAIFSYNEKYLSYLYKKNMGITFSNYINKIRISHSEFLMKNDVLSISVIAEKCGFTDVLYFQRYLNVYEV